MLSEKTKGLFAQFLESLKEDTGLEPESVDFWQHNHRGNTTEEMANTLVERFNFETYKHDGYNTVKTTEDVGELYFNIYYSYAPGAPEEAEPLTECSVCEKEFHQDDLADVPGESICMKCNYELQQQGEQEQKELEQYYYSTRL